MQSDPETPPFQDGNQPSLAGRLPPPLPVRRTRWPVNFFSVFLSLFLGLFLAEAVLSLADDSLVVFFDLHVLTALRSMVASFGLLMALVVYVLMGFAPAIPKRLFLPLALFGTVAGLITVPCLIYFYDRMNQVAWGLSLAQVLLGLVVLHRIQGGVKFRWPLVPESRLTARRFSWRHLLGFLAVNVVVLVPVVAVYLAICASLAVNHFSDGFVALRPGGVMVQARKYARADGRTIHLVPMSHIGETDFYRTLTESFPTNAIILMEGVSDDRNLLTNRITYQKMAAQLGVAEQQEVFLPKGEMVRADVDVSEFAPETINFLNLTMLIHSKGLNAETVLQVMQFSEPHFEKQLLEDILKKRNQHVLKEIRARLAQAENLIVPWGAAHMPEIAREIQKAGFRVVETQEHVAIRFGSARTNREGVGAEAGKAK